MGNKLIFLMVGLGIVGGVVSALVYAAPNRPQPPVFSPAPNPYSKGIYAEGIVESFQAHGENTNLYPEVAGVVTHIFVTEGEAIGEGTPLLQIEDSVQRATVEQLEAQASAAKAMLDELKAQPRKETLEVVRAQADLAAANLRTAQDQLDKQLQSYQLEPKSVSKDALDNYKNAAAVAKANLDVALRQLQLTRAGAWVYDIQNQERQYQSLSKAAASASAVLSKYTLRAPFNGSVLSILSSVGSYISPQGAYDTYTQGFAPVAVLATASASSTVKGYLAVRCYIDEILIPRLPPPSEIRAELFIRGTTTSVPLEFVRMQPYVSPKIQLSNARTEKVDVRVLPLIFRFIPPPGVEVYPGEMVDVYVGDKESVSVFVGSR